MTDDDDTGTTIVRFVSTYLLTDRKEKQMSDRHNNDYLHKLRHSVAHVMAQAVLEKFPEGKIAIGPPIEDGFYYDFDLPRPLTPDDLKEIEARMKGIVAQDHPFEYREISEAEARELFVDQPYKLELIRDILSGSSDEYDQVSDELPTLSIYKHGPFVDLCRGPHLASTKEINPRGFKLLSVAGAYWRGDERQPMLQRIYGTTWRSAKELRAYLHKLEELKARDHRHLNKQLDLYSVHEEMGAGLIIYGPKAARIRAIVEEFWRQEHFANGYELLYSPHIGHWKLWETSGHLDFYQESMYSPMAIDGVDYYLKPMNCPFHMLAYKARPRSYRDLPLRWAELGTVYRYERSGVLHGLLRTRGFTQDDAHIICTPEQIEDEIVETLRFSMHMWDAFGFEEYEPYLATCPEKSIGTQQQWDVAVKVLCKVLDRKGLAYKVDEGGGAFYGPKIDLYVKDSLGRGWQLTTIQFDFNLPERFDMVYKGEDGLLHRPYMVHRTLLGSWERFFGCLIEHYAGAFPVWLSPLHVQVIPIADRHNQYAYGLKKRLKEAGLRVEVDHSGDRMQAKIRKAQLDKIPYMLVIGDREVDDNTVAVRLRTEEDLGAMDIDDFIARAKRVIEAKRGL
jgi:threonyl-tRNA synthetase